ncbi:hypothetical protein D770_03255 [Flammeovirgaceae bacterium 311]|nr:hypothetical protein D770_03255 [Flammeovirgaceae bacterium 311]
MLYWKNLNNRGRILLLLMISLVLLNIIVVVTTFNLKKLSESVASIMNDRLIPSTEIALIQGYCYQNRLDLEDLIFNKSPDRLRLHIQENNKKIDSTVVAYRHSYFTEEEMGHVTQFSKALREYRQHEEQIQQLLNHDQIEEAKDLFYGNSQQAFVSMIQELHQLSDLQIRVGRTLQAQTDHNILVIKLVAYCSLCLSIFLAARLLGVLGIKPNIVSHKNG